MACRSFTSFAAALSQALYVEREEAVAEAGVEGAIQVVLGQGKRRSEELSLCRLGLCSFCIS